MCRDHNLNACDSKCLNADPTHFKLKRKQQSTGFFVKEEIKSVHRIYQQSPLILQDLDTKRLELDANVTVWHIIYILSRNLQF